MLKIKIFCGCLIVILFSSLVWLLSVLFLPKQIYIINDFSDITSKTFISIPASFQQKKASYWLDTLAYSNAHHLFGLTRYDPSTRQIPSQASVAGLHLVHDQEVAKRKKMDLVVYNPMFKQFLITSPSDPAKKKQLLALITDTQDRQYLLAYYQRWTDHQQVLKTQKRSPEQQQFIEHNAYEIVAADRVWHYFHHHEAMFGPINAYHLGLSNTENNFLYGWLGSLAIYKVMQWTGDFNFHHYLEVLYSVYPLYYFFWVIVIYFLTRNIFFTLLATILMCGCVYLTGFEEMRFQPGLNPLRHCLDLPMFVCLRLFLTVKNTARYGYALLITLLAALAILVNVEFGLSLSVALCASLLIYAYGRRQDRLFVSASVFSLIATCAIAFLLLPKSHYSQVNYFFMGGATPPANYILGYLIGAASAFVYLFLLFDKKNSPQSKILILFICFYFQACSTYYIIYPAAAHMRTLFPIAIIAAMLLLKNILTYIESVNIKYFWQGLFVLASAFYALSLLIYASSLWEFLAVKKNHHAYFWSFNSAQFFSDMNPKPFANALQLIDRYANGPGIYMISKYDNLLYWLSDHYGKIPYGTLALDVPSLHEKSLVLMKIKQAQACYLFVDADIASSHFGDVSVNDAADPLAITLHRRFYDVASVGVYYALADIFYRVKADYHLKEHGDLIDVYEANRCGFSAKLSVMSKLA